MGIELNQTNIIMEINGHVYCFFEQSGVFKNEFKKLGYDASDWDIQDNFGQTDHVMDLFAEIDNAYCGKESVFDTISSDDLVMAFFPCIYFCDVNEPLFALNDLNYRKLSLREKYDKILDRAKNREYFFEMCIKFFCVCDTRGIRMIMENPYSQSHYLVKNFVYKSRVIDRNRRLRGDYFVKPTQYWYVNCEPTHGQSFTNQKIKKTVCGIKGSDIAGLCGEERSLISPDYARNFICNFVLGKSQSNTQFTLNF